MEVNDSETSKYIDEVRIALHIYRLPWNSTGTASILWTNDIVIVLITASSVK
jgi:hypothetical protein